MIIVVSKVKLKLLNRWRCRVDDKQFGQIYIAIQLWLADKAPSLPKAIRQIIADHIQAHHLLDICVNEVVEPELLHKQAVEEIHNMLRFAYKALEDNNLLDNESWKNGI